MLIRVPVVGIEQPLHRQPFYNGSIYDLAAILRLYLHILIIIRLDSHQWPQLTQPLTSGLNHSQMGQVFLHLYLDAL